jgi:thiamine-phosphate pyrophosphorylase
MERLNGLHIVTDALLAPGRGHIDIALATVEAGAPVLQMRDKTISDGEFYRVAQALRQITVGTGTLFVVNDRVDIALAVGADGIHVGQTDMPAKVTRGLIGSQCLLGVSASSIDEAVLAYRNGADYVGFGPIFSTATKADAAAPTGIDQLRELKSIIDTPIVAIGGINEANIGLVASAGANGAAVVSAVVCAEDMRSATRRLSELFRTGG